MDVGNNKKGNVGNLPEICSPEVMDPIAQPYNDIDFKDVMSKQLKDRAILAVINDVSLALNNQLFSVLPGDEVEYGALDKISNDLQHQLAYPEEFLISLTPTVMLLQKLPLKIGCIIMLLRKFASSGLLMEQD